MAWALSIYVKSKRKRKVGGYSAIWKDTKVAEK